jgi:hypothetical protein
MIKQCVVAMVLGAALASVALADTRLHGAWSLNGAPYLVLNQNGTGTLEGEPFQWRAQGQQLVLTDEDGTESVTYRIQGNTLTLTLGPLPLTLQRMAGTPEPARSAPAAKAAPGTSGGQADGLAKLLLSSAWCSFRYNQTSGATNQTRVQFFANGTYANSGRADTYSSNPYGSVAGQHGSGGQGQWAVRQGQLYMSAPNTPTLQPVDLTVTRNSNGYPILRADGMEYSMCQ